MPALMKARMQALIHEELNRLPVTLMPEDWRWSLVYRALLRLQASVDDMEIPE